MEAQPQRDIRFVLLFGPGSAWQPGVSFRDQPGIFDHVSHYRAMLERGELEMGGPFVGEALGGIMVPAAGVPEDRVRAYASEDPSIRSGVLTFEIRPWLLGLKAVSAGGAGATT